MRYQDSPAEFGISVYDPDEQPGPSSAAPLVRVYRLFWLGHLDWSPKRNYIEGPGRVCFLQKKLQTRMVLSRLRCWSQKPKLSGIWD